MNNNNDLIRESVIGDIMDVYEAMKSLKDTDITNGTGRLRLSQLSKGPLRGTSSISKASSNLVMVFPVIASRSISIEAACMVNKALEKNIVSMLQRLFASWQIADDGVQDLQGYISRFHNNMTGTVANLDDIFRVADTVQESCSSEDLKAIKECMKDINTPAPSAISESSLMRYKVKGNYVHEASPVANARNNDSEIRGLVDRSRLYSDQVMDGDYKKANELMPTSMIINFSVRQKDGSVTRIDSAVAGVKAKLYPIPSEDVINNISKKVTDSNWITNFVRATSKEISFWKDFVFAVDKAKIDAISNSDRRRTTDRMWKVLERRALASKLKRASSSANAASSAAITTLCVSGEDVEILRKNYNIDLERIAVVSRLFSSLNLMCIVIVDEALEVAKFIYDEEDPSWESISFSHLERESSDNTYKRVVNLMTKVSR